MEQFSHDLTLALEETSRCGTVRGRWGMRRRTRSTGNLPCAPQPTEDSSSSPTDPPQNSQHNSMQCGNNNTIQSDSDDRHAFAFAFKLRQTPLSGNFESDSLNENFSPARPNTRRKRKFKRMAVEYETTPSTPHASNNPIFPIGGTVKRRVWKHAYCQDNFRANLFSCGKRKRCHRDRYMDYESHKQHSSSVPRQRDLFPQKAASYLEYKNRNRASSFTSNVKCEKILPLNKSIVSKIEKISQDSQKHNNMGFQFTTPQDREINTFAKVVECNKLAGDGALILKNIQQLHQQQNELQMMTPENVQANQKMAQKSGSFESALGLQLNKTGHSKDKLKSRKSKHIRRHEMKMHLPFDEQNFMDCASINDFLSSSSLSSSDSEAVLTNETDHEGDDELTDWPGNEAMINFASKNDFKRANKCRNKPTLPQIKQQDDIIQDDDTLMSADEVCTTVGACSVEKLPGYVPSAVMPSHPPSSLHLGMKYSPANSEDLPSNRLGYSSSSMPIEISGNSGYQYTKQIESEMSGETSNNFLSSPNNFTEIREIRAGCRRIREERPGYSIISSANEYLSRFLQDDQLKQLTLYDMSSAEHDKLLDLCRLYSLNMEVDNGCVILNKTSNTMQSVRIDQSNLPKRLSDFKRRCYGDTDDIEFNEMTS